ncbi:MAG TPA: FRG domain-containing protein, partial [Flavisolibacter sp.]|nr:FRG domain-containing protein [Flavisolibacter sp.]
NPSDYGTLLGLAQHHGLPTPLLDFTDSPYIAAYFAFSDAVENKRLNVTHVRIYAISGDYLASVARPHIALATAKPYITSMMLSARHNPRLYAQQGRFLITNVSDIEDWLLLQNRERPVLSAADIPVECAATALEDLKYMGLTAGTLFPGLDGVCRAMKQTIILNATNRHHVELSPLGTTAR